MSTYSLIKGNTPLLISMPHNGIEIPSNVAKKMTPEALNSRDTDWFMDVLYDFAESMGASVLKPKYSRYVIDLNRGVDGENLYPGANSTELCPTTMFDLSPIYLPDIALSDSEIQSRIADYWVPYHTCLRETLSQLKQEHGYAILLDAHSILSVVPRFFEGKLPDFNFGTADGKSCSPMLTKAIESLSYQPYSQVCNGRFKGGYITREYGDPKNDIHAIQLELSQSTYMNEKKLAYDEELASQVKPYLKNMVKQLIGLDKKQLSES